MLFVDMPVRAQARKVNSARQTVKQLSMCSQEVKTAARTIPALRMSSPAMTMASPACAISCVWLCQSKATATAEVKANQCLHASIDVTGFVMIS